MTFDTEKMIRTVLAFKPPRYPKQIRLHPFTMQLLRDNIQTARIPGPIDTLAGLMLIEDFEILPDFIEIEFSDGTKEIQPLKKTA